MLISEVIYSNSFSPDVQNAARTASGVAIARRASAGAGSAHALPGAVNVTQMSAEIVGSGTPSRHCYRCFQLFSGKSLHPLTVDSDIKRNSVNSNFVSFY